MVRFFVRKYILVIQKQYMNAHLCCQALSVLTLE